MKTTKNAIIILCMIYLFMIVSGCKSNNKTETSNSQASSNTGKVLVKVNEIPIYESEVKNTVDAFYGNYLNQIKASGKNPSDSELAELKNTIMNNALEQAISEELLIQDSKKLNLTASDSEINSEYSKIKQMNFNNDNNKFLEAIKQYGFKNEEEYLNKFKRNFLIAKYVQQETAKISDISDDKLKEFYKQNEEKFAKPETRNVKHILTLTGKDSTSVEINEKMNLLKNLKSKLDKGEKFEDLASKYSDCPSKSNGGDLGLIPANTTDIDEDFKKAAFSLKLNQVSSLVKTKFGYHLIKVTKIDKAGTSSFEEVKLNLKNYLLNLERQNYLKSKVDSLKLQAKIVYNP